MHLHDILQKRITSPILCQKNLVHRDLDHGPLPIITPALDPLLSLLGPTIRPSIGSGLPRPSSQHKGDLFAQRDKGQEIRDRDKR